VGSRVIVVANVQKFAFLIARVPEKQTANMAGIWDMSYLMKVAQHNFDTLKRIKLQNVAQINDDRDVVAYRIQPAHQEDCSFATHFVDMILQGNGILVVSNNKDPYATNSRLWIRESATSSGLTAVYILDVSEVVFQPQSAWVIDDANLVLQHSDSEDYETDNPLQTPLNTETTQRAYDVISDSVENSLDNSTTTNDDIQFHHSSSKSFHISVADDDDEDNNFSSANIAENAHNTNIIRVLALTEFMLNLPNILHQWGAKPPPQPAEEAMPQQESHPLERPESSPLYFDLDGLPQPVVIGKYTALKLARLYKAQAYCGSLRNHWLSAYRWLHPLVLARFDQKTIERRQTLNQLNQRVMLSDEDQSAASKALSTQCSDSDDMPLVVNESSTKIVKPGCSVM
jgi:hypothetical protein